MVPNIHIHEKLMFERQREVERELEQRRILQGSHKQHLSLTRHVVRRLGTLLIALGTNLKRIELSGEQA